MVVLLKSWQKGHIGERLGSDKIILIMTFFLFSCLKVGVMDVYFYFDPVIYVIYLLPAIMTLGFASYKYTKTMKNKYENVQFLLFSCLKVGVMDVYFYFDPVIYVIYLLLAIMTLGFASYTYTKTMKNKYENVLLITLYIPFNLHCFQSKTEG